MFSQATSDGVMTLTVTFKLGTDRRQGAGAGAEPCLAGPAAPAGGGAPPRRHDDQELARPHHGRPPVLARRSLRQIYLRNYATLQVKDDSRALPASARCSCSASGDYAMRVWLDPGKIAARGLTASDVVNAIREQNVQVAAGAVGAARSAGHRPAAAHQRQGTALNEEEFGDIIVKTGANGAGHAPARRGAHRTRRVRVRAALAAQQQAGRRHCRSSSRPAPTRSRSPTTCAPRWRS